MKVLHIINSLGTGGAEKLILDSLPIMKKNGIDVDLYLLKSGDYPFEETLRNSQFSIHNSQFKWFYNPFHIFKIIPVLKKYDIVHVHLFPALYWVALAKVFSFSKTKLIFTEHNTTNRRVDKWYFKIFDGFIYNQYSEIVAISEKVRDMLSDKIKIESSKIHLIKNGINLEAINNALPISRNEIDKSINETHKIIIQISRFQPQKDQKTLIKAMKLLPENVILILVGEGELKTECQELSSQLNLNHRIYFLGVRMDVPSLLKTADIVVLSSHYEGLSLASIEALASGKPFVASKVPGLSDVVENAGLLFEENNETELSKHILDLLQNDKYYDKIVNKCLSKSKEFDIIKMVKDEIELYKRLI
jgi:glycosyltransferase involved in cell wall biosynthesis